MVTKTAVEEGLKTISAPIVKGGGGAGNGSSFSVWGIRRRPPRAVRPLCWSTEKQVTPATAPVLRTHAECQSGMMWSAEAVT